MKSRFVLDRYSDLLPTAAYALRRAKVLRGSWSVRRRRSHSHHDTWRESGKAPSPSRTYRNVRAKMPSLAARDLAGETPLVHDFHVIRNPLDAISTPIRHDSLRGLDQLTLIHYCDAGNRRALLGKMSPDRQELSSSSSRPHGSATYP